MAQWRKPRPEKVKQIIQYFEDAANWWPKYANSTIAWKVGSMKKTVDKLYEEWLTAKVEAADDKVKSWMILWRQVSIEEESSNLAIKILNKELKRIRNKQEKLEELSTREIEVLERVSKWVFDRVQKKKSEEKQNIEYNIIKMQIWWDDEILKELWLKPS